MSDEARIPGVRHLYAVAFDHPSLDDESDFLDSVVWVPPNPTNDELTSALLRIPTLKEGRWVAEVDIVIRHAARIHDVKGAFATMREALIAGMGVQGEKVLTYFLGYAIDSEEQVKMLAEALFVAGIELPDLGSFTDLDE